MNDLVKELQGMLNDLHTNLNSYLPAFEAEIDRIIHNKCDDSDEIEYLLDTLLSTCQLGIGNPLYIKLLEYYKHINAEGAAFYWKAYDSIDD